VNLRILISAIVFTAAAAAQAHDENAARCVGLEKYLANTPADLPTAVLRKIAESAAPPGVDCTSLGDVILKLVKGTRVGGKRLEEDKPFDRGAAQANLDQALREPQIVDQIAELERSVADEKARILYEAAILDAEGFYGARDLRIQQYRDRAGD